MTKNQYHSRQMAGRRLAAFNKQVYRVFAIHRDQPNGRAIKIADYGTMTRQMYRARRPKIEGRLVTTVALVSSEVANRTLAEYRKWDVPFEFRCACSVPECQEAATCHADISINGAPHVVLPVCGQHADAAAEDHQAARELADTPEPIY